MGALVASPIDPSSIFLAKLCATFIFMAIAETASVVLMVLFFNLDFDAHTARVVPVLAMGTLGFSALATLTAAVAGRTRLGDLIVPILAVPMFVPALIAGVKASAGAMTGAPWDVIAVWIRILLAFDVLFVASGWMLFEYVARGD
jgi:heme exporter protein B